MAGQPGTGDHRVIILSAGVGAGHDGAARAWSERLARAGYTVQVHDLLGVLRRRRRPRVAAAYEAVLHRAPWLYQVLFSVATRPIGVVLARALMGGALPRVADLLGIRHRRFLGVSRRRAVVEASAPLPAAVLCTYPLAGHVLGELRRQGRLHAPVLTFLTDFSVHRLCVAPGVDAHLAVHQLSAEQAVDCGGRRALVCGPVVGERFRRPIPPDPAPALERDRFGLPHGVRLALLVAGSWGIGEVEVTAAEIASSGVAVPVVVCGRNERLRARLADCDAGIALGWITDMPALMRCVDVLVENAGGLTSLEAMAVGLPVASYRPIAGHGRTNAAALADAGVTSYIRQGADLASTLLDLIDGECGRAQRELGLELFGSDPVEVFTAAVQSAASADARGPEPARDPGRNALPMDEGPRRLPRAFPRLVRPSAGRPTAVRIGGWARPVIGLAVLGMVATIAGNTSTEFAVAHGVRAVLPSGRAPTSYLVLRPGPDTDLSGRTGQLLQETSASIAVDRRFAQRRPDTVRGLADRGVPILITESRGPQLDEVHDIRGGADAIFRVTGSRPTLFVPASRVDAIDLGVVTSLHDRVVQPRVRLERDDPMAVGGGQVMLIDCSRRPCDLPDMLTRIQQDARQAGVPLGSIAELADEARR